MRTGRIWINTYNQIPAGAPFGGYKNQVLGAKYIKMLSKTINKLKISLLIQATKLKVYINKRGILQDACVCVHPVFVEILLQLKAENIFEYYTKIYLSGEK